MTTLFFDVETTGLPNYNLPTDDPCQPHLVQLALLECTGAGAPIRHHYFIIRPDGWEIPSEVLDIHGITHRMSLAQGIPASEAVGLYILAQGRSSLRVAHNESFGRRIMRIAMIRAGYTRAFIKIIEDRPAFCTMTAARPILNLPPSEEMVARKMTQSKPPKLAECVRHFFGEDPPGAPDAMIDTQSCARIYYHMRALEDAARRTVSERMEK